MARSKTSGALAAAKPSPDEAGAAMTRPKRGGAASDVGVFDRSGERQGSTALVVLLALGLVGAVFFTSAIDEERRAQFVLWFLAGFSSVGIAALFLYAIGFLQIAGRGVRNDITKLIADRAHEGLVVTEGDRRVLYANETYLGFAGTRDSGGVKMVERLFTGAPEVSEAVYRLAQASRDGRAASEEVRLSPPLNGGAGGVGWYRVRVRPLSDAGPRRTLWHVADITRERERHENVFLELQNAVDYLDHAPAGFLSADQNGVVVYVNATLASWLDYDIAEIGANELRLRDIVPGSAIALLEALEGRPGEVKTDILDLDMKRRGGQTLPVRLFHRVAYARDGTPGPSRTLVLNRSQGEDTAEGQRAAEVRFARFFNNSPLAIATVQATGAISRTNAPFTKLFSGVLKGGDGGRSILATVAEKDRAALTAALKEAAAGRIDISPVDVQLAGEGERSMRFMVSAVDQTEGDGEAAIVYAIDTTEQRELQEQFAQANKMQAVGQLAGGVAHDFNNVLTAIIGYSDLLLANHRPTDPSFQDIMQIKQNANRAASLVRQLLAFSRRQTLRPQVLQLTDTVSDLSMLLKRLLGEQVELQVNHGRDLWPVMADVNQFEQVVMNLAVNARDAMAGGGKLSISTQNVTAAQSEAYGQKLLPRADWVALEVTDSGGGIRPEILEKIFEPFFTTKEVGKGTGLGLSTVYGIVKQSGGFIFCDSVVGQGATFRIFLPRHVPEEKLEPEVARLEEKPAPVQDLTGHGTILLVEDEEAVRAFAGRALRSRGYTVLEAASGVEALSVIEKEGKALDLVVSDVVMPEMDGPTLLRELRKEHPDLKVIFVSGYAEEAFKKNLPEGAQFAFLAKPFSLKQLVEAVKGMVPGA